MQLNFGTYCMYKKMIYNVKRGPICQNILKKKNKSHPKLIPWFSDPHESDLTMCIAIFIFKWVNTVKFQ